VGLAGVLSVGKETEARLQADGVIPVEPPIPIDASAAIGYRTIWRAVGKQGKTERVAFGYSGGSFDLHVREDTQLGWLLQEDHEAFFAYRDRGR